MKKNILLVFSFFLLISCNNDGLKKNDSLSSNKKEEKEVSEKKPQNNSDKEIQEEGDTKTLNNIKLHTTGDIKVSQAYLIYGDDETLVPSSNITTVGRPIKLVLLIDKGWKEEDGQIAIGASEKIETNTGQEVLSSDDLFAQYPSMKAEYGNIIKLKAVITEMTKQYEYFTVSFKVWDKKSNGEITGNYRFYVTD